MNGKDTTKIYLYEVEEIRGNLMLQRLATSWVLVLFLIVDDLSLSLFPSRSSLHCLLFARTGNSICKATGSERMTCCTVFSLVHRILLMSCQPAKNG